MNKLLENTSHTCRLCSSNSNLFSLLREKKMKYRDIIRKLIEVNVGIRIEAHDNFGCVCINCVIFVYNIHIFKEKSLLNEEKLQGLLRVNKRQNTLITSLENISLQDFYEDKTSLYNWITAHQKKVLNETPGTNVDVKKTPSTSDKDIQVKPDTCSVGILSKPLTSDSSIQSIACNSHVSVQTAAITSFKSHDIDVAVQTDNTLISDQNKNLCCTEPSCGVPERITSSRKKRKLESDDVTKNIEPNNCKIKPNSSKHDTEKLEKEDGGTKNKISVKNQSSDKNGQQTEDPLNNSNVFNGSLHSSIKNHASEDVCSTPKHKSIALSVLLRKRKRKPYNKTKNILEVEKHASESNNHKYNTKKSVKKDDNFKTKRTRKTNLSGKNRSDAKVPLPVSSSLLNGSCNSNITNYTVDTDLLNSDIGNHASEVACSTPKHKPIPLQQDPVQSELTPLLNDSIHLKTSPQFMAYTQLTSDNPTPLNSSTENLLIPTTGVDLVLCQICDSTLLPKELKKHERTHRKCSKCQRTFRTVGKYEEHRKQCMRRGITDNLKVYLTRIDFDTSKNRKTK